MTLHELHPEELIDKAAHGDLDASERTKLDHHLSSCAVCRFETQARSDFRANEEEFSDDAIDMIVGASLRGADARAARLLQAQEQLRREPPLPRSLPAVRGGRRWAVLLAAAVLLVSAQATARWLGIHAPTWLAPPTMTAVTTKGTEADDSNLRNANAPKTVPMIAPIIVPVAAPSIMPATVVAHAAPTIRESLPRPVGGSIPEVSPSPVAVSVPNATASALFTQANADRTEGRHVVATREYRELLESYPNAPEADLSRATLGRLMLDDGDAMGALPLFDEYLRIGGPLREETMTNRATALERLHRIGEESAAWHALLDAYPQSLHADRARMRLEELGAR